MVELKSPRHRISTSAFRHLLDSTHASALKLQDGVTVFAALFLLRLIQEQDQERLAIAEFDGAEYEPKVPCDASWEQVRTHSAQGRARHFFDRIVPTILRSTRAQGTPLQFLLAVQNASSQYWTDDRFSEVVEMVSQFDVTDMASRNSAAKFFQDVIEGAARKERYSGEFVTPEFLRTMIVDIAAPLPGDRVYDPCFGSGGLLVTAAKRMIKRVGADGGAEWAKIRDESIFGIERNLGCCLIAAVRLILAGIPEPRLECGDTLERGAYDHRSTTGFDCIIANPPFGLRVERTLSSQYRIPSNAGHNLFLQHILGSLRRGGRAVVLVPETLLFSSGADESLRKLMLTEYRLDEVISLPSGALGPHTSLKSNILVARKLPPRKSVWLPGDAYADVLTNETSRNPVGQMLVLAAKARAGAVPDRKTLKREIAWIQAGATKEQISQNAYLTHELADLALQFASKSDTESESVAKPLSSEPKSLIPISVLAANDWLLLAKRFEPSSLDAFIDHLTSAYPTAKLLPLDECAKLFLGMRYRTVASLEDDAWGDVRQSMRTIRVQDLSAVAKDADGLPILDPSAPKIIETFVSVPTADACLREGDLLVSVGGTIGKVVIVGKTESPSVASNGLVVIRCGENLLSEYLGGLLQTRPYQEWFLGQSTGTSIRHLSVRALRRLKVPILTLQDQQSLTPKLHPGSDERTISATEPGSLRPNWLDKLSLDRNLRELVVFTEGKADRKTMAALLRRTLEQGRSWRNALVHDSGSDALAQQLLSWLSSAEDLDNALSLQRSTERWGALQSWLNRYNEWEHTASAIVPKLIVSATYGSGKTHILHFWRQLEKSLKGIVKAELRDLTSATKLAASVTPPLLTVGKESGITLAVRNEGALPLRKLIFETEPFASSSGCATLSSEEVHQWTLKVRPLATGKLELNIRWSALGMDGASLNGVLNLALEVRSLRESAQPTALGESPYIVGNPIDETKPNMFFGREATVNEITRSLRTDGPSSVLLLEGNRRAGKTSILLHLRTGILPSVWLPVYCNFQKFEGHSEKAGVPTGNVFYGIAKEFAIAAATSNPRFEIPGAGRVPIDKGRLALGDFFIQNLRPLFQSENPFERFQLTVEAALEGVGQRRFLLMLDEFDKIQEGIESGITSPQVPENLRNLFHTYNRVSGILSGSRNIKRLRSEYWNALFGLGKSIVIKGLDESAARRLVTEPVTGRLVYAPLAIDLIVAKCARQPFLIQGLCDAVFELCAESMTNSVTAELVEEVAPRFAKENGHFRHVWDHISSDRQRFLVCLVDELSDEGTPITGDLLQLTLQQKDIDYQVLDKLQEDLDELIDSEVLGVEGKQRLQTYRIEIPLFAEWLRKNVDAKHYEIVARNEEP
jgi:type I restriction enzyme M protein